MKDVTSVRKTYELTIGDKKYKFRLSFMCWLRLEERYKVNATCIVDEFVLGVDRITNMMRILSCACVDDEITAEELSDALEFTPQNLEVLSEMTIVITGLNKKVEEEAVKKNSNSKPRKDDHIVDYEYYYTLARSYLGYSYNEFWYEANPYEVMGAWNAYVKLNGWDKQEDEGNEEDKDYCEIDDL